MDDFFESEENNIQRNIEKMLENIEMECPRTGFYTIHVMNLLEQVADAILHDKFHSSMLNYFEDHGLINTLFNIYKDEVSSYNL